MTREVKNNIKTKSLASCTSSLKKRQKMDDTEYLLASPANKASLEKSIDEIKRGKVRRVELFRG